LEAYEKKDLKTVVALSEEMKELLDDVNRLVSTHHYFLAGKWNKEARRWGTNLAEQNYYEEDARRIITVWGGHLSHYANRCWNGILDDVYKPTWVNFFDLILYSIKTDTAFNYARFMTLASYFEWNWVTAHQEYISEPVGDSYDISRELYQKWSAR
jgi:alpha-N-acetylglucosaminidase